MPKVRKETTAAKIKRRLKRGGRKLIKAITKATSLNPKRRIKK